MKPSNHEKITQPSEFVTAQVQFSFEEEFKIHSTKQSNDVEFVPTQVQSKVFLCSTDVNIS